MVNYVASKLEKTLKTNHHICLIIYKASRVLNANGFPWAALDGCMSQTLEACEITVNGGRGSS